MTILAKLQAILVTVGYFLRTPFLLIIRLYWGWQFFLTGKGKLMHLDKTAHFFASLNIPAPKLNAIMASSTECTCGLLLLAGLFSRFASFALICVMCVALYTADRDAVNAIFSDTDKLFATDPFLFLYASTIVFCFGPGKVSIDALFMKSENA
jgi:putative oxidoreductase